MEHLKKTRFPDGARVILAPLGVPPKIADALKAKAKREGTSIAYQRRKAYEQATQDAPHAPPAAK